MTQVKCYGRFKLSIVFLSPWLIFAQKPNSAPTFITFDVPGSTFTAPSAISPSGTVTGTSGLPGSISPFTQGFVRTTDGIINTFMVPGGANVIETYAEAINGKGTIAGYYNAEVLDQDTGTFIVMAYGFVRSAGGVFTTFSAPGAGIPDAGPCAFAQSDYCGTYAVAINLTGTVAGYYLDENTVSHGFAGDPEGTIISFDPPSAAKTSVSGINASGTVTGHYIDLAGLTHAFVRVATGEITTFDALGADRGTFATGINDSGAITGYYASGDGVYHSFLRAASGAITEFDAPGAGSQSGMGTFALSINAAGAVTGYLSSYQQTHKAFVRSQSGAISTFQAPGAGFAHGNGGTTSVSITRGRAVTGTYIDSNAFIRILSPSGR